jgi:DNA-binding MarR family transcriptional regulator
MDDKHGRTSKRRQGSEASRPAVDYGELNERIGYLLRRAQVLVFSDFFQAFSGLGISPAQYSILTIIGRNPGLSQTEVADALGIKKTNFVAVIKDLEKRGLVRRKPTPDDKRSFALSLSGAGAALLSQLHTAAEGHEQRVRDLLGPDKYEPLFGSLKNLRMQER